MTIEEIKAFLESNKDQPEVSAFLGELSAVSADKVKGFLQTEEGKRLIQPTLDKYHAKSLESWKANNLEALIDAKVKELNPEKTPAELELEKLKKQFEDSEKARAREKLMNQAIKQATEKNLPVDLLDYFVADDEETTTANLAKLEETFTKAVQMGVEGKFKDNGRNIQTGGTGGAPIKSFAELAQQNNIRNQ